MTIATKVREQILISPRPLGHNIEGVITGTPKPGTFVTLSSDGTYVPAALDGAANGMRGGIWLLINDDNQGQNIFDAVVTGTRNKLYKMLPGDEAQLLIKDVSGTGDTYAIGQAFMIENASGKLIAVTGTIYGETFELMEAITPALAADTLALCRKR